MAFRLYDPNPTFISLLGTESTPGGTLTFYDQGTTTPKDTFSDAALTIPNANPVELDASGRADTEIWLDGGYTVTLRDADGTVVWVRDVVPEVAPGNAIPDMAGNGGKFLSTDGSLAEWVDLQQLPDPAGSANEMVVVNGDGTGYLLQPIPVPPEPPEPDIAIDADAPSLTLADGGDYKLVTQYGSGSAPASGTKNTSTPITFGTPYAKLLHVSILPTGTSVTASGAAPTATMTGATFGAAATGFTANFNVSDEHGGGTDWTISSACNFIWKAEGLVEAEEE